MAKAKKGRGELGQHAPREGVPKVSHLVSVARTAVLARVRRALAGEGKRLAAVRGTAYFRLIDTAAGRVESHRVELEQLARKMAVLHPWECVGE
jgi:hypothetical protein